MKSVGCALETARLFLPMKLRGEGGDKDTNSKRDEGGVENIVVAEEQDSASSSENYHPRAESQLDPLTFFRRSLLLPGVLQGTSAAGGVW